MRITRAASFILGYYVTLVIFWFAASLFITKSSSVNILTLFDGFKNNTHFGYIFAFAYGFVPLFGSIIGFNIAKKWGFLKGSVGKAAFFLSLSLLSWAIGEFIWSYYNFFLNAVVPYPSWADAGFVLNYPFWGIGMVYLGEASGAKLGLQKTSRKVLLVVVPLLVAIFSWYVMVVFARSGSITSGGGLLKMFFDIAYPVGDVILLTMGLLIFGLSFKYWDVQIKWPVIVILVGILTEYFADFAFAYTTTNNTFYNGGWVDLSYTTSLVILSLGVAILDVNQAPKISTVQATSTLLSAPVVPSTSEISTSPITLDTPNTSNESTSQL